MPIRAGGLPQSGITVNLDEQDFLILRNVEGFHFTFIQVIDICCDNVLEFHINFSLVFRALPRG
jgi:hypothetical protein